MDHSIHPKPALLWFLMSAQELQKLAAEDKNKAKHETL